MTDDAKKSASSDMVADGWHPATLADELLEQRLTFAHYIWSKAESLDFKNFIVTEETPNDRPAEPQMPPDGTSEFLHLWLANGRNLTYRLSDHADHFIGSYADEAVFGGEGNDLLEGGGGRDHLDGGDGADSISGGSGDDFMIGAIGADQISDGEGADRAYGGPGNDTFYASNDTSYDIFDGGDGADVIVFMDGNNLVDLSRGFRTSETGAFDQIRGIEAVVTGAGDDRIIGSANADDINGGFGRDIIYGLGGDDLLNGGDREAGNLLYGGEGNDTLLHFDEGFGGEGDDVLAFGNRMTGGAGADRFAVTDGLMVVTDFTPGVDTLDFSTFLGEPGDPSLIRSGFATVHDMLDAMVETPDGLLLFATDSSGAVEGVLLLGLTRADLQVTDIWW